MSKYIVNVDVGFDLVFGHKPTWKEINAALSQKLKNAEKEADPNLIRYTILDSEGNEVDLEG